MIEEIERLGDLLGEVSELTNSLYKVINWEYGINSNTLGIWELKITLEGMNEKYTKFHRWIFKELGVCKK